MSQIWYPFTQMKSAPLPHKVVGGKGAVVTLEDGRELVDCISSWWVNLWGHCHPDIAKAIYEQSQKLEHVIFAGFTHEPALRLATKLLGHLPKPLNKVFYSDNGSTAVEAALKIAYQYFVNIGKPREKFLCFEGSYHGDTVGAMSLGNQSAFFKIFEKLTFKKISMPYPATFPGDSEVEEREEAILAQVEQLNLEDFVAVVIEPLVQGVSGMQMCRPQFLQKLEKIVRKHGTLLIYDEVMTGFGRIGEWFACLKSATRPDLICLAKGLTGGFLPLAVTVCTDQIYDAFCSDDASHTFSHGHSYTANPLGCAAAIATLNLLEQNPASFKNMEQRHAPLMEQLNDHPLFEKARLCGTIAALDLKEERADLRDYFLNKGLLLRPLGRTIYLMPPYCITDDQLKRMYQAILEI